VISFKNLSKTEIQEAVSLLGTHLTLKLDWKTKANSTFLVGKWLLWL
jgi:hypothetical protein